MRNPSRRLLVLHADPVFAERVREAAHPRFKLEWISGWKALPDAVREAAPSGLLVVDPYFDRAKHGGPAPNLHALLRNFPSTPVVAAPSDHVDRLRDVGTLGEWGVSDVIDVLEDTVHTMQVRIEGARGRPLRTLLEREVPASVPGRGRAILDAAVDVVATGGHARDLARDLHLSPATLLRWCRRSGIPVPRRLLVWMRALLAAELLDDPGQTVLGVALACGYSSDRTLRRALYSATGFGPTGLRNRGAFKTVAAAFVAELKECRRASAQYV